MKYETLKFLSLNGLFFLTFFSGFIRHDVDVKAYLQLASESQFECVGRVFNDTTATGSCVLINDRFVLSAAHVFIESDTRTDTMVFNGKTVISYVNYNERVCEVTKLYLVFKDQKVKVKKLTVHPNYLKKGSCDIALLELEQPLKNITPAKINKAFDELNANVVGVGFGVSGSADKPEIVSQQNKKIGGENVIDSIGGKEYKGIKTVLICDFDHPTLKDCNKMGSHIPRPLEYICSGGDSGGGLFRKKQEEWELIGICSGSATDIEILIKSGYYGQTMEWTRISAFTKWIDKQIK